MDESGKMLECYPYSQALISEVGNIYIGVVKTKIKGIGGYFIDYGSNKNGLLPINKSHNQLSPGQSILVQVEKDAYQQKGAKLTTKFSLTGECCVLITDSTKILFSSKLPEDERTKGLKSIFKKHANDNYGFIVRTNAYSQSNENIIRDIQLLESEYHRITQIASYRSSYNLLHGGVQPYKTYIRNLKKDDLKEILCETKEMESKIRDYLQEIGLHNKITVNIRERLYISYDINKHLSKANNRKVWLPSGASLIIDKTEAMYVIDVNSDKNISKRNNHKNILKINLEAAKETARQLRLRNMSGIIIIDFIDVAYEEDKQKLLKVMEASVKDDPVKVVVHGMTHLNLMEVTRKRIEPPLLEKLAIIEKHLSEKKSLDNKALT